ncbi:heat-inducible transcription repressor HrcA [Thermodesulfitimonas autotrophica]|uniref:Heat-inducible transcription repressor HrcA n=1 Tax=Thermodesulfitimonas autotrophica TaxID=1894989 RepID=A0A3N5AP18_9THEO|nr:heat-inducible transcriptional repressor HrcA [Thermodesulfitimonas autotrophica]RPF46703.1 heat-inducible transcription repressor HrcA [Thermodesulfitimonas autotrophica]
MLDERKERILAAVVEDFIDTAEPIGSRTIARKYGLGISPATIRNEMADLEEMGYLKQPHTSAGRIPSERGYRYYVDHLMEPEEPGEEEKELLRSYISTKSREIAGVIRQTGQILSQLTSYAAIATAPCGKSMYRHIQLVPFGVGQAMVLVVLASGDVFHRLIPVPEGITAYDLEALSRVLNAKLRGLTVRDIKLTLLKEIYAELSHYKSVLDWTFELIQEALQVKEERIYQGGIHGILTQPEFRDVSRLQTLLGLLDQEDFLCDLLTSQSEEQGLSIRIGEEFNRPDIRELSMVAVTYRIDDKMRGVLAVLGPTRMRYRRVAGILRYVAESLSAELVKFFR